MFSDNNSNTFHNSHYLFVSLCDQLINIVIHIYIEYYIKNIKPENRKLYAENLAAAATKTNNKAIQAVDKSVRSMLNNLYDDENVTF